MTDLTSVSAPNQFSFLPPLHQVGRAWSQTTFQAEFELDCSSLVDEPPGMMSGAVRDDKLNHLAA